jgi:hypothetical protein
VLLACAPQFDTLGLGGVELHERTPGKQIIVTTCFAILCSVLYTEVGTPAWAFPARARDSAKRSSGPSVVSVR